MNLQVLRLLLRPAAGQKVVLALPIIAFATVSALLLTVIGGAQAFWSWTDPEAGLYQALAAIALVLLVIPLVTLGGAAARLSARRRDERLSTLRLLGVTPAGVVTATVIESALLAAAGALVGVLVYLAAVPLIGLLVFRGEALGGAAVLLPALAIVAIAAGIVVLAVTSAAIGLRAVVISPLGVRTRAVVPRMHWIRVVITAVVLLAAVLLIRFVPAVAGMLPTIIVLSVVFGAGFAVLNVIGPWALSLQAKRRVRRAVRADQLISARIVLDSPKAAWRQVSGVAMTSFMAVFAGTGVSVLNMMSTGDSGAVELLADIQTGVIITLVASFLMVAASIGVNQASAILDRTELHESLHRLGMPLDTADRARTGAIMSPLLFTTLGSAACAAIMVIPLLGVAILTKPAALLTIATIVAAGIGIVWLSTRATKPLLRTAFAR